MQPRKIFFYIVSKKIMSQKLIFHVGNIRHHITESINKLVS